MVVVSRVISGETVPLHVEDVAVLGVARHVDQVGKAHVDNSGQML